MTARREHGDAEDDVFYEAAPDLPDRPERPERPQRPADNEANEDPDADLDIDAGNEVDRHPDHSLDRPPER